jgi:hypothetical protein
MTASTTKYEDSFQLWCARVDAFLKYNYVVNIADVGWTHEELRKFWERDEEAEEFVEWFGLKYDLDPATHLDQPFISSDQTSH